MNTLNFLFNETALNVYGTTEDPIFVVNDICQVIGANRTSALVQNTLKEADFQPAFRTQAQIPQYRGRDQAVINEFGLYEILFRSNSDLAKQFRREICVWLKEQRLSTNLIKDEKIKSLEQLTIDLKESNKNMNVDLDQEKQLRRQEYLSKNYNHRITKFYVDDKLAYAIYYDEKYRNTNVFRIINLFADSEIALRIVHDLNHYGKSAARSVVKGLNPRFKLQAVEYELVKK